MKDRKNLWSMIVLTAVAMMLFLICASVWDLYAQTETRQIIRILADCCTVPGVLYVGMSLIGWIGSKGTFDIFGYSVGGLFRLLRRDAYEHRAETFYDYRTKKDQERKPFQWGMMWVGLVFVLLAVALSVAFSVIS